jgi:PKD domain
MRFRSWGLGVLCLVLLAASAASAQGKRLAGVVADAGGHGVRISRAVPARAGDLPYGGGPVLHANRTHVIFWEPTGSGLSFEPGYESLVEAFLHNVAAASRSAGNVYGLTGQYRDSSGPAVYDSAYGGAVIATDRLPPSGCQEPATGPGWQVCLTDSQLQREIEHVVRADHLPTGPRDVYFLLTPDGLGDCSDSSSSSCALGGDQNGYCGYHSETNDGLVLYAVIPYNAVSGHCQSNNPRPNNSTADPALSTISHEHSELITDPLGNAWIDESSGNEDGDLCLSSFGPSIGGSGAAAWNESINGGHYYLQEEWSNANQGCAPRARPDSVSFRASTPTSKAWLLSFLGKARPGSGSIVAYRWFFGDSGRGTGRVASHSYTRAGRYRVILRTTDSWGNWTFYARTVAVRAGRGGRAARATKSG